MIKYYIAAYTKAKPITNIHPNATTQANGRVRLSRTKPTLPEGSKFLPLQLLNAKDDTSAEDYTVDHTTLVANVEGYLAIIDAGEESGDIAIVNRAQAEYLIANHEAFKPVESEA